MRKATGVVAAASEDSPWGAAATTISGTTMWVEKPDWAKATTRSPGLKAVTPAPTAATRPAHSRPSRGPAKPSSRISSGSIDRAQSTSRKLRPVASTAISIWPGPGATRSAGPQCISLRPPVVLRSSRAAGAAGPERRAGRAPCEKRTTRVASSSTTISVSGVPDRIRSRRRSEARFEEIAVDRSMRRTSSEATSLASVRVKAQMPASTPQASPPRSRVAPGQTTQSRVGRVPRCSTQRLSPRQRSRSRSAGSPPRLKAPAR